MVWSPGKQLNRGRYRIERELGRGGNSITYLAKNKQDEAFAIKTLNDEFINSEILPSSEFNRWQEIFIQEAFKLAKCSHPHIVRVEEIFPEDGVWCIVMEYIAGTNLASYVQQQTLLEQEALQYIQQIGNALITVHNNGFLHRKIGPENILLRHNQSEGKAVLIDFSLARPFDQDLTETRSGEIADGFTPMELYSHTGKRGPYTDIYALGATLYLLLTGETPPNAQDRYLNDISLQPPQEINPQISDRVNDAIILAMALEPEHRPQSIKEWFELMKLPVTTEETSKTKKASRSSISVIDQMIVLASGGAFVGGLIAQFYGAVIGAVFGAIFAVLYKKNRSHN